MPIHDWTRVDAGVSHASHQQWIIALSNALNAGILPSDYDALPEQLAAGFGPDVLTLQGMQDDEDESRAPPNIVSNTGLLVSPTKLQPTAESDLEFYRRKQTSIGIRHVSGDRAWP